MYIRSDYDDETSDESPIGPAPAEFRPFHLYGVVKYKRNRGMITTVRRLIDTNISYYQLLQYTHVQSVINLTGAVELKSLINYVASPWLALHRAFQLHVERCLV